MPSNPIPFPPLPPPATATKTHSTPLPPTTTTTTPTITTTTPKPLTRKNLLQILPPLLQTLCKTNTPHFPPPHPTHPTSLFYSIHPPLITLETYITRLLKYSPKSCSTTAFIIALVYLDRLQRNSRGVVMITFGNVHRLFLTCVMIASKYIDDDDDDEDGGDGGEDGDCERVLKFWAEVGGVGCEKEMGRLELQVLKGLKWRVWVEEKVFRVYEACIFERIGRNNGGGGGEKVVKLEKMELNKMKKKKMDRGEKSNNGGTGDRRKIRGRIVGRNSGGKGKLGISRSISLDDAKWYMRKHGMEFGMEFGFMKGNGGFGGHAGNPMQSLVA